MNYSLWTRLVEIASRDVTKVNCAPEKVNIEKYWLVNIRSLTFDLQHDRSLLGLSSFHVTSLTDIEVAWLYSQRFKRNSVEEKFWFAPEMTEHCRVSPLHLTDIDVTGHDVLK